MALIEGVSDDDQPILVGLVCPYCGTEGTTTLPPRKQVKTAEIEISHECGYTPWTFKVVTK